jgi:uncharacterized C2H2 Zn-finger protein
MPKVKIINKNRLLAGILDANYSKRTLQCPRCDSWFNLKNYANAGYKTELFCPFCLAEDKKG